MTHNPRRVTLELSWPQFFALRSLVAEHLLCPKRSELYVSVAPEQGEVTHEELLDLLLRAGAGQ
jgi:hypothetical protein